MRWRVTPSRIGGSVAVPGDKSIAHRALMLAALAPGVSHVHGVPEGDAVRATANCLRSLGVRIDVEDSAVRVESTGRLAAPEADLFAGNSATSMRLLAGILSGQPFPVRLTGDAWLSRRPMQRIIEPLRMMGAQIQSADGKPPLDIHGGVLRAIDYALPVASAQVKSAVLLAGLFAQGETRIAEPRPTRDHTERLFKSLHIALLTQNGTVAIRGGQRPVPFRLDIPGDLSSAAFFLAAAALSGGTIEARSVGLNPTRTAFLQILERMGASVEVRRGPDRGFEPAGDILVGGPIHLPVKLGAEHVPAMIDELPLVALLATQATGTTVIRGAAELRVKETDRLSAVASVLRAMGAGADELPDGLVVRGPTPLQGAAVHSFGDHRIAMLAAVAAACAHGDTVIEDAEASTVSFPEFAILFRELGGRLDVD